ncbi:unnamed protein product [Ceratitis capitata]|uniref:(Mediterranean fruit fly) hypothetical protein n=1 Tax=Ceratitis capitata TaxID=7213 RepID=A0A811V8I2_CERCA|nr:unnamed protein product [Ceratitis capitata]
MKVDVSSLEVISPKVQISDNYIETDYEYQTSHVKRTANGRIQIYRKNSHKPASPGRDFLSGQEKCPMVGDAR